MWVVVGKIRPMLVEHTEFDHLVGDDADAQAALARLKQYNGNRRWSAEHFGEIQQFFMDDTLPQGSGLTDTEYEDVIANYEPHLTQEQYERNVTLNVRMAFGMCGLAIPKLHGGIEEAIEAAKTLEGRHALVVRN